jgi:hypothetical protein
VYPRSAERKTDTTFLQKVMWANRVRLAERPAVFFHIGGHKTGTTFLQNVLWHNRARLRRDGLLYPGRDEAAHVWANFDLRDVSYHHYRAPQVKGAWERLAREIRRWRGPAIISQEMFSVARPAHIRRALRDLDFADVHVVFTARDMARQLPSAWQEWVKNRSTITFAEFLAAVREPTREARRFMNLHDVPAILERWSNEVTAGRVHLITVPPPGSHPRLLWERFAGVLHLELGHYNLDVLGANPSLGAADAALLRRINVDLAEKLSWPDYDRLVKSGLALAMATRPDVRIALPDEAFKWAVEWAGQAVEKLAGAGYQLVGDFDDLIPKAVPAGEDPDCVGAEAQASAAIAAVTLLLVNQAAPRSDNAGDRQGKDQPSAAPHERRFLVRLSGSSSAAAAVAASAAPRSGPSLKAQSAARGCGAPRSGRPATHASRPGCRAPGAWPRPVRRRRRATGSP